MEQETTVSCSISYLHPATPENLIRGDRPQHHPWSDLLPWQQKSVHDFRCLAPKIMHALLLLKQ